MKGVIVSETTAAVVFDLMTPEGERRLRECMNAPRVITAISDYAEWLHGKIKYGGEDDADEKLTEAWNRLHGAFRDNGVNLPGWE